MNGFERQRKRVANGVAGLILGEAALVIGILVVFQLASAALMPPSPEAGNPATSNLMVFIVMFAMILVPTALIGSYGYKWVKKNTQCPSCGAEFDIASPPEDGCCRNCRCFWDLDDEEEE